MWYFFFKFIRFDGILILIFFFKLIICLIVFDLFEEKNLYEVFVIYLGENMYIFILIMKYDV